MQKSNHIEELVDASRLLCGPHTLLVSVVSRGYDEIVPEHLNEMATVELVKRYNVTAHTAIIMPHVSKKRKADSICQGSVIQLVLGTSKDVGTIDDVVLNEDGEPGEEECEDDTEKEVPTKLGRRPGARLSPVLGTFVDVTEADELTLQRAVSNFGMW